MMEPSFRCLLVFGLLACAALARPDCQFSITEQNLFMVSIDSGDNLYTASILTFRCADDMSGSMSTMYLPACANAMATWDESLQACKVCPAGCQPYSNNGGALSCLCPTNGNGGGSGSGNGSSNGNGNGNGPSCPYYSGMGTCCGCSTVDMQKVCDGSASGCLIGLDASQIFTVSTFMQQGGSNSGPMGAFARLRLPTLNCSGLPPYAKTSGPFNSAMPLPSTPGNRMYNFLRLIAINGLDPMQYLIGNYTLVPNLFSAMWVNTVQEGGITTQFGPGMQDILASCSVNSNLYFDATLHNGMGPVPSSMISVVYPDCNGADLPQIQQAIQADMNEIVALSSIQLPCSQANSHRMSSGRRMSDVRESLFEAGLRRLGRKLQDSTAEVPANLISQISAMDCDSQGNGIDNLINALISRVFINTAKDSYAGCKRYLDSWVNYVTIDAPGVYTSDCTVSYSNPDGTSNPAWLSDPCCNYMLRYQQCCAPRMVGAKVKVVSSFNNDAMGLFSAATGASASLPLQIAGSFKDAENEAAASCFGPMKTAWSLSNNLWSIASTCYASVWGSWDSSYQLAHGGKCTSDADCFGASCQKFTSSTGTGTLFCISPMSNPTMDAFTPLLTCMLSKLPTDVGEYFRTQLAGNVCASMTQTAEVLAKSPGLLTGQCMGMDWQAPNETQCLQRRQCNWNPWQVSDPAACANPCAGAPCPSYCAANWGQDISTPDMCLLQDNNIWQAASSCSSSFSGSNDCWSQLCPQYCSSDNSSTCATFVPPQQTWIDTSRACQFPSLGTSKDACLGECLNGPNPVLARQCLVQLNPLTANWNSCWNLSNQAETHYPDTSGASGYNVPPDYCVIHGYWGDRVTGQPVPIGFNPYSLQGDAYSNFWSTHMWYNLDTDHNAGLLCEQFANRTSPDDQALLGQAVLSVNFSVSPWASQADACSRLGTICYADVNASKGIFNMSQAAWVPNWCSWTSCDRDNQCSGCNSSSGPCQSCCQCFTDALGLQAWKQQNAQMNGGQSDAEMTCNLLSMQYGGQNGMQNAGWHFDPTLLNGQGACTQSFNGYGTTSYNQNSCAHPSMKFFKMTRKWVNGQKNTQTKCEANSCSTSPWLTNQADCENQGFCQGSCPQCSAGGSSNGLCQAMDGSGNGLTQTDCQVLCGGTFNNTCFYAGLSGGMRVCIAPSPSSTCVAPPVQNANLSSQVVQYRWLNCSDLVLSDCGMQQNLSSMMTCSISRQPCRNKQECNSLSGNCQYMGVSPDDVQQAGGLCVLPLNISMTSQYSLCQPIQNRVGSGFQVQAMPFGCAILGSAGTVTSATCSSLAGKWFPFAWTQDSCEVDGYAWKQDVNSGAYLPGTMMCCTMGMGGNCWQWSQDSDINKCQQCGGSWTSIFTYNIWGGWRQGVWGSVTSWKQRQMIPVNSWGMNINQNALVQLFSSTVRAWRSQPINNFLTCRMGPSLSAVTAIASQSVQQVSLGKVCMSSGATSSTKVGGLDVKPPPAAQSCGLATANLSAPLCVTFGSDSASSLAAVTDGTGMAATRLLASTSVTNPYSASCFSLVVQNNITIGQLVGDCINFQPSASVAAPVTICMPISPTIPKNPNFTLATAAVQVVRGQSYKVVAASLNASLSSGGSRICVSVRTPQTYCPVMVYPNYMAGQVASADNSCAGLDGTIASVALISSQLVAKGTNVLQGFVSLPTTSGVSGSSTKMLSTSKAATSIISSTLAQSTVITGSMNLPLTGQSARDFVNKPSNTQAVADSLATTLNISNASQIQVVLSLVQRRLGSVSKSRSLQTAVKVSYTITLPATSPTGPGVSAVVAALSPNAAALTTIAAQISANTGVTIGTITAVAPTTVAATTTITTTTTTTSSSNATRQPSSSTAVRMKLASLATMILAGALACDV